MASTKPPPRLTLYPSMGPHWSTARPRDARGFEYVRCPDGSADRLEFARELSEKAQQSLVVPTGHLSYGRIHISAEMAEAIAAILYAPSEGAS